MHFLEQLVSEEAFSTLCCWIVLHLCKLHCILRASYMHAGEKLLLLLGLA